MSLLVVAMCAPVTGTVIAETKPRVFVFSDIKVGIADPDDRQSLAHLMYYADEVDICGIHPDAPPAKGSIRGCEMVFDCYEQDYNNPKTQFKSLGYPTPDEVRSKLSRTAQQATKMLTAELQLDDPRPLYVLVWGSLANAGKIIRGLPAEQRAKVRVISIATNIRSPANGGDGKLANWNNWGDFRQRFWDECPDVFWIEIDWTYQAMHQGKGQGEPGKMVRFLAKHGGALGKHIEEVMRTKGNYFRVGDTPTLLYLLDPKNMLDDPTHGSWAGKYCKPFPHARRHYYTDIAGGVTWDFADPAKTWNNANAVYQARINTLLDRRAEMYAALRSKINQIYSDGVHKTP